MAQFGLGNSLPPVVKNLLIANVVVFLAQFVSEQQGYQLAFNTFFALQPIQSGDFKIWQLVTHMFMHGGIWHIVFNMFGLWMFGSILENHWGSKRFFQFYMICGIIAGIAHLVFSNGAAIGASGAIMGIFAAFAYLFPNTPLYLYFIPIPIKAKWAMPGLILVDVFSAISPRTNDNVAHWAHIGGALAGLALVIFWNRTKRKTFY
jgi:membrane associated rhomboid family serine protease